MLSIVTAGNYKAASSDTTSPLKATPKSEAAIPENFSSP